MTNEKHKCKRCGKELPADWIASFCSEECDRHHQMTSETENQNICSCGHEKHYGKWEECLEAFCPCKKFQPILTKEDEIQARSLGKALKLQNQTRQTKVTGGKRTAPLKGQNCREYSKSFKHGGARTREGRSKAVDKPFVLSYGRRCPFSRSEDFRKD